MLYFILGYLVCVLFPVPWVNAFVVSVWSRVGEKVAIWLKGSAPT